MFFLDEISKKEAILFEQSSSKEILFYSYLTNKKYSEIEPNHSGEVEKVCLSAFGNSNIDVTKEILQGLKAQPVKGFHFSTNIISLIAYSLKSDEIKNKHLSSFFNNSTLTNQFIISRVFDNYSLLSTNNSRSTFDLLINEVIVNKDFEKGKKLILDAFQEVSDLIELFVVRYSYEQIILQHPNSKIELNFNELSENLIHLISATKRNINRNVNIVVLLFGVILIPSIPYFIKLKWDEWGLEPYITGVSISLPILSVLFVILFNSNPSWANFIKKFKLWLLERWFKRRNMDFNKIKKLIKYEEE
jgi:hypothetical protein